jgi:tRNA(adenine34) deaminase
MFTQRDEYWMRRAIELAEKAAAQQEVPVGAILVLDDQVIGEGYNCSIMHHDPSAHAEMLALRQGAQQIKNYRLVDTTLYATLEPCSMCTGALVHARIQRLIFGAHDKKAGAVESNEKALDYSFLNHRVSYAGGLLADHCGTLLSRFFKERRRG